MNVTQIYELVNNSTKEVLGETAVVNQDLSNVVDIGTQIFNAEAVDRYVKSLVNHIGKVIFVNRPYSGTAPSVLMDGWEFGSVLEKIQVDLPDASESETWELENGASYDPNIFYQPKVSAKFFNNKVCYEVPMSFTEKQVKQSFSSAAQLNGFIAMIYNSVEKSMTVKIDSLVCSTINNMIALTVKDQYGANPLTGSSGVRAVNLLYLYNQRFTKTLTAAAAITDPDFIRFASFTMGLYSTRVSRMSSLFNGGGKARFTSPDLLHVILLNEFSSAAASYLMSDTFHENFVALPKSEVVPFWQGSGTDYGFSSVSAINVKDSNGATTSMSGILGIMFDRDALGVSNLDRRVTTSYNSKAEFFNNFYKFDAGYFNDQNENFIVFFVA